MTPPKLYSPVQLANYMRLVRQKNQWTQNDLSKRIGIKQATISNFENNPNKATLATMFKIMQSLEMTMVLYEKNTLVNTDDDLEW